MQVGVWARFGVLLPVIGSLVPAGAIACDKAQCAALIVPAPRSGSRILHVTPQLHLQFTAPSNEPPHASKTEAALRKARYGAQVIDVVATSIGLSLLGRYGVVEANGIARTFQKFVGPTLGIASALSAEDFVADRVTRASRSLRIAAESYQAWASLEGAISWAHSAAVVQHSLDVAGARSRDGVAR